MRSASLLVAALLLAACGDRQSAAVKDGVLQTGLPGMETAGGRTSGEVIAAESPAAPVNPGPAGTPGIPLGSGGNTGGTALGSSVPKATNIAAAANTTAAPTSAASAPLSAASAAALEAQQEQVALEQAQDRVATAWRARASGPRP